MKKLLPLLFTLISCIPEEQYFRQLNAQNGCFYEDVELTFDIEIEHSGEYCTKQLALCIDTLTITCNLDPKECRSRIEDCNVWSEYCWDTAKA